MDVLAQHVPIQDSLMFGNEKRKRAKHKHAARVAFGTAAGRFGRFTQHPALDRRGHFTERSRGCDPCRYLPKTPQTCKVRPAKGVWRFKQDLEDWAANLGYRNTAVLEVKNWLKTLGGPAWYDPKDLPKKDYNACRNVGFGRTPRFKVSKEMGTPPPGTYYHRLSFKAPYGPHSQLPTFEREEPCRFIDKANGWSLAPNRYVIKDPDSVAEKPKKITSLKGPYNLTSGPRILVQRPTCSAATWPLALPGSFETFKKTHLGVMNKSGFNNPLRGRNALVDIALAIKKPSEPGPAEQNIEKLRVFNQYRHGFNSSDNKPVGYIRGRVWPAVGRYSISNIIREQSTIPGKGHTHLFTSKVQRTFGAELPKPMNTF